MGKSGASSKRALSGSSGESTPESRMSEVPREPQDEDDRSNPSDDGQDDAQRAGEQVLNLLKGVDQKKLIALLQSGALEDVMTNQVQGAKKLAKVVQECVYPLWPRDVRDMYDVACQESYAGYRTGPARNGLNCWNQWIPSRKRSLLSMRTRTSRLSTDVRV